MNVPCDKRACPVCGPRVREQRARDLAELVGLVALWRLELAAPAWRTASRRLQRAGVRYLAVPVGPASRVVFVDRPWPRAVQVDDNQAELTAACARLPAGGRVRPSAGWQPSTHPTEPDPADGWRWAALRSGVETMYLLVDRHGCKPRRGPDGFSFTMPDPGTKAAREITREILTPGRRPRRPGAAA